MLLLFSVTLDKKYSMMKHASQPSVSPWRHKDSGSGEITVNCDCNSTWRVIIIRFHGKSY